MQLQKTRIKLTQDDDIKCLDLLVSYGKLKSNATQLMKITKILGRLQMNENVCQPYLNADTLTL